MHEATTGKLRESILATGNSDSALRQRVRSLSSLHYHRTCHVNFFNKHAVNGKLNIASKLFFLNFNLAFFKDCPQKRQKLDDAVRGWVDRCSPPVQTAADFYNEYKSICDGDMALYSKKQCVRMLKSNFASQVEVSSPKKFQSSLLTLRVKKTDTLRRSMFNENSDLTDQERRNAN